MSFGGLISGLAHGLIIALLALAWPKAEVISLSDGSVGVDLVDSADIANVKAFAADNMSAVPSLADSLPAEEVVTAPADTSEDAAPALTDVASTVPPPPVPDKGANKGNKPAEKPLDLGKISALIDKSKPAGGGSGPIVEATDKAAQSRLGIGEGTGDLNSVVGAIRSQVSKCWNPPVDLENPERLIVKVTFSLGPDGKLKGEPRVVNPVFIASDDRAMQVAAERAKHAIRSCAPFTGLPPKSYATWREVTLNFNLKEMLGQ